MSNAPLRDQGKLSNACPLPAPPPPPDLDYKCLVTHPIELAHGISIMPSAPSMIQQILYNQCMHSRVAPKSGIVSFAALAALKQPICDDFHEVRAFLSRITADKLSVSALLLLWNALALGLNFFYLLVPMKSVFSDISN